jgi:hypothetical protein
MVPATCVLAATASACTATDNHMCPECNPCRQHHLLTEHSADTPGTFMHGMRHLQQPQAAKGGQQHKQHNGDRHRQHKGEQQHRWQLGESKQQIRAADTAVQALKCKVAARRSKATCSYTSRRPQHSTTNTSQHHSERIDRGYRLMATLLFV